MKAWEYNFWSWGYGVSLDELGKKGWEAVGIAARLNGDEGVQVLLKRELPEEVRLESDDDQS